ncbi:MAG: signal peptide peptidase SppA [Bacteroidota bacterium]
MKSFWKVTFASLVGTILASIVLFFLMFLIIIGIVSSSQGEDVTEIEQHSILKLDLSKKIVDRGSDNPLDGFNIFTMNPEKVLGLNTILANIEKAGKDDNIDGIYLNLSGLNTGIATIQEIRNSLRTFKESGKCIVSYSDYYTQTTYYLASVADKVYLNPEGEMMFVGLSAQLMFFKKALEKFGVKPVIIRHGKFKSAVEPFMYDKMSEANREQVSTYIGSIWQSIQNGIAKSRNIDIAELNNIADNLLLKNPESAVELGFVDSLLYYDEMIELLKEKSEAKEDKDLKLISLNKYTKVPKKRPEGKKGLAKDKIAVIYASGEIVMGKGKDNEIGAESLSKTIRTVRKDKKVKAIVLRVNSPGGSALASEIIWREVVLAKKEKPVIVSMGDLAASGGYYIACVADTILASHNTLTGSIGVFGLLFNVEELMNKKIGITFDKVNTNRFSDIGSVSKTMEKEERAFIQSGVEEVYATFIQHVADGRGMTTEQVDSIGQGRVWSGSNALEIGLVDKLGGLEDAIDIAAEKAGLDHYRVVSLPKQKEPFEKIMEQLGGNIRINLFGNDNNEFSRIYEYYQSLSNMKGVQARMPFEIEIN